MRGLRGLLWLCLRRLGCALPRHRGQERPTGSNSPRNHLTFRPTPSTVVQSSPLIAAVVVMVMVLNSAYTGPLPRYL